MGKIFDELIQRPVKYLCRLTPKQRKTLREFDDYNERRNLKRLSKVSLIKTIGHLGYDVKKEFQDMNKEDVNKWLDEKNIKPYSKVTYQHRFQGFFKWLGKDVKDWFIKIENAYDYTIAPTDLWTPQEINELIVRYPEVQYRALVATLFDSEARVSELCSMNIQDVEVVAGNAVIFLRKSKTKKRRVELVFATKELLPWYNLRKEQAKSTDPLWISKCNRTRNTRLSQGGVWEILKYGRKLLGTEKHINPHLLRHSMASYLCKMGFPDRLHKIRMGLSPNSNAFSRYTHVSDKEVSDGARKAFGAEPIERKVEFNPLLPKKCPRCGTENRESASLCSKCYYSIDYENTMMEVDIVQMFHSNFANHREVRLDLIYASFKHLKQEVSLLEHFLNCFNGKTVIEVVAIKNYFKKNVGLDDDQVIELISILMGDQLIDIVGDKVFLLDRKRFDERIELQRQFIKANA